MKKNILVTELAQHIIFAVSRRCVVETGGVLVGILGDPLVIVAAGQPGANAIHRAVRFTTDPEADKECLTRWRQIHGPVIEVVGWYHKHYRLQEPSGGDLNQVRQLRDEFQDNRPILMGIVSENGLFKKNLKLRIFGLDDAGEKIEYDWKIIPNDSPEIEKAIKSVPPKPEIKDTHFWNDPEFQFYTNQLGRQRIRRDIQELKNAGWDTSVLRNKANGGMILKIKKNIIEINLHLPPEYPLNAPIVLGCDSDRMFDFTTICEWNSLTTLVDIVTEAEQKHHCSFCSHHKELFRRMY